MSAFSIQRESISILLIHFHSLKNAGDAAQLEAAIDDLSGVFKGADLVVASNHPDEMGIQDPAIEVIPSFNYLIGQGQSSTFHQIINFIKSLLFLAIFRLSNGQFPKQESPSNGWTTLLSAYRDADLIVSTPGNIFFTMGSVGFPFLCSALAVFPAMILKKPFYVLPQSIGPLERWWERWLLKRIYSYSSINFLREPLSYRLAEALGLPMDQVQLKQDMALSLPPIELEEIPPELQAVGFNPDRCNMGVTVIQRMVKSIRNQTIISYHRVLADSLSEFIERHEMDIYFFPQVTGPSAKEDDRIAIGFVVENMTCSPERIKVFEHALNHEELRTIYAWMDLMIASRMHSGVFALSAAIPTLMIAYLSKSQGLMEALRLDEWCVDIDSLDQGQMLERLESLYKVRETLGAQIRTRIEVLRHGSTSPAAEIAKDYYDGLK